MKKILGLIAFAAMVVGSASCGKKQEVSADPQPPIPFQVNSNDSTEVAKLVDEFMDHLVNGEPAEAVAMLGNGEHDSISSYDGEPLDLPAEVQEQYASNYSKWDVDYYAIEEVQFGDYRMNKVRVRVFLKDGTSRGMNFNPIKSVNGWRLTVRDSKRGDHDYAK